LYVEQWLLVQHRIDTSQRGSEQPLIFPFGVHSNVCFSAATGHVEGTMHPWSASPMNIE